MRAFMVVDNELVAARQDEQLVGFCAEKTAEKHGL